MKKLLDFKDKRSKCLFIIFSVVILIAIIVGILCWFDYNAQLKENEELYRQLISIIEEGEPIPEESLVVDIEDEFSVKDPEVESQVVNTENERQETVEINVLAEADFERLQEVNQDIYAWIKIANTKVNYPILQNTEDDYYLKRCINGKNGLPGCIYTNPCHAKDFSSWNTVIYGHNMINGSMFGSLKLSNDWETSCQYIEVKLPNQTLKYRVYAVTEFSDTYLPVTYNETSNESKQKFLDDIYLATKEKGYYRKDMVVSIEDKFVTLSTCIKGKNNKRLLVVGVLE